MARKKAKSTKSRPKAAKVTKPIAKKPVARKAAKPAVLKDGRPGRMWWPALAPYMTVRDGQASIEFYSRAFGFQTYGDVMRNDTGAVQHASMRLGEAAIMFAPEGEGLRVPQAGTPDSLSLYIYVPDVDAIAARAVRGGASTVQAPKDQYWRDRTAVFKDPDGYHWTFATHLG